MTSSTKTVPVSRIVATIPHETMRTPCTLSIPFKPILIVSDNPETRSAWARAIQEEHYQTQDCSYESFLIFSRGKPTDISLLIVDTDHLTDLMCENSGFFHAVYVNTPVILIGDGFHGRINRRDYPEYLLGSLKEFDAATVLPLVYSGLNVYKTIQQKNALGFSTGIPVGRFFFFGNCPKTRRLREEIEFAAAQDGPVLIEGESGTCRDLVASQIHAFSRRARESFDVFPFSLGLSEFYDPILFGLERGGDPQFPEGRIGKLEMLHRGTIYIEDVDQLLHPAQERLLSFLKNRSLHRLHAVKPVPCETRVLVSGSPRLKDWLSIGAFSRELFETVSQVMVHVPPLRERVESIPDGIEKISSWMCEKIGREHLRFSDAAVDKMRQYSWPGNVDEFLRAIRHQIYTNRTGTVEADDIVFTSKPLPRETSLADFVGLTQEELNDRFLRETLQFHRGNRAMTAKALGISEKTLYKKLKELKEEK